MKIILMIEIALILYIHEFSTLRTQWKFTVNDDDFMY